MKRRILDFRPEIDAIIKRCEVCSLAMSMPDGRPYVVIMNFGYKDGVFYFHSSPEGMKINVLREFPEVCIALSTDHHLRWQNEQVACSYGMKYRSVTVRGSVEFMHDLDQKKEALNIIMQQYTEGTFEYSLPSLENVCVFRLQPQSIEARAYGY
ncbi:MAG TPA: pyridoxamine 5'-phosphate oxidase family protein [Bacteroidales bacterium]|nr:pyridoxamine 5'-phosphate oxidase family protein [Bacteroidales bacterium]